MTLLRLTLGLLLVLIVTPLINLVLSVPPGSAIDAFGSPDVRSALYTSLTSSLLAILIASVLGIPAGYALARGARTFRALGVLLLAVPLALPPVAAGIALLGLVGVRGPLGSWLTLHQLGFVDSFAGVVLAEFFVSGSIVAIAATAAFSEVDPTLEDAARTLGAGPLRVLGHVALPAAWPPIAAGMLFGWLRALGEYGATSILAYHPNSLPIALVIALSADGVPRALALAEGFLGLTVIVVGLAAFVRRPAAQ